MPAMQLAQAILFVDDAAKMQAFYERHLGLRVIDGDAKSGFVRLGDPNGGAVLALHYTRAIGKPTGERVDTPTKLCFHVDDVAAARNALASAGVTVRDLHTYGAVSYFDAVDPEGNIFQLTTR